MLRERRELVESELQKARSEAAKLYLEYAIFNQNANADRYHELKSKIADLNVELSLINDLIEKDRNGQQ